MGGGGSGTSGDGRGDDDGRGDGGSGRGTERRDAPDGGAGRDHRGSGGGGDGFDDVSTAEKTAMAASIAFTVALFGVAVWYALTGPGAVAPTVRVVDSAPAPGGGVEYAVELRNPGDVGLVSATVEAGCTDPPAQLVFENVPADGRRTGTVVCPAGTTDPAVSVSTWITG